MRFGACGAVPAGCWLGIGLLLFAWGQLASRAEEVPGQVLVKMRSGVGVGGLRLQGGGRSGLQVPEGARVVRGLALPGWHLVQLPPALGTREGVAWFRGRPEVAAVEPNQRYRLHLEVGDPMRPWLPGLDRIGAPAAWAFGRGRSNIVVAVLDTGIDLTHPDLTSNLWINDREVPGNGIDDDQNGWVDDVHGADFADLDGDPMDDAGHGTHVAGTIGATADNGLGVVGVSPGIRLLAVRVLRADGSADTSGFLAAFDYVVSLKRRGVDVRVINCSWGGGSASLALREAIQAAGDAGILVVCSAGNDRQNNDVLPTFPAGYDGPEVLAVAASGTCGEPANFSNFGWSTVHLGAPGRDILSTYRGGERYAVLSGTSMAAPHVSGAAALLASLEPRLSVEQLRNLILTTVDRSPEWEGVVASGGALNLGTAVGHLAKGWPSEAFTNPPAANRIASPTRLRSGRWGNDNSTEPVPSADGRWVAFTSWASNLVPGDTEGNADVFMADRVVGTVVRVSQGPTGVGGNGDSGFPSISADGRYVAFVSSASNLVATDPDGGDDVYLWDRETRRLELVSVRFDGQRSGNGASDGPMVSGDGRWIAFASEAGDLVANDGNERKDVFLWDRVSRRTERVSVDSGGREAVGASEAAAVSYDGRVVAFHSGAANLVAADRNDAWDVFVRDRETGITELASQSGEGSQGSGDSVFPILGGDGRWVLFHSLAQEFDERGGGFVGVFLRDRQERTLTRVNARAGRTAGGDAFVDGFSADGRYATFTSDDPTLGPGGAPKLFRAWVFDRLTGGIGAVGVNAGGYFVDDNTYYGRPSADGRYVAFSSYASTPMPGHGSGVQSVFVEDRGEVRPDLAVRRAEDSGGFEGLGTIHPMAPQRAGITVGRGGEAGYEVLLANGGGKASFRVRMEWIGPNPGRSWGVQATWGENGSDVTSALLGAGWRTPVMDAGSNLVLRLRVTRAEDDTGEAAAGLRLQAYAEAGDSPLDRVVAVTETSPLSPAFTLASRGFGGGPSGRNVEVASVSGDGSRVAFSSEADHLEARMDVNAQSDIFVFERDSRTVRRISDASATTQANDESRYPSISADGRRVAFQSRASNLVPFDNNGVEDVFVKDLLTGTMSRVSVSSAGKQGNRGSESALISADGRFVAFGSLATNLVAGDTNASSDVFLRRLDTGEVECISRSMDGSVGNADSEPSAVSGDGRFVLFASYASNLVGVDTNRTADVFLHDRAEGRLELVSRNTNGVAANAASRPLSVSDDGRWVTFQSFATDLVPGGATPERWGYVLDRQSGRIRRLVEVVGEAPADVESRGAVVSADGRLWAMGGRARCGRGPGIDQVWVKDLEQGGARMVSQTRASGVGVLGEDHSFAGRFSRDGRFLTFETYAENLVGEMTRGVGQMLLADLAVPEPVALARRLPTGPWRGLDGDGGTVSVADKSVALTSRGGTENGREFGVRLVNFGSGPDRFRVRAVRPGAGVGEVRLVAFVAPAEDVTEAVFGEGWVTPVLASGASVDMQVEMRLVAGPQADLALELQVASEGNPYRTDLARVLTLADADGDGLPDMWEVERFGGVTVAGRDTDFDGDGASDYSEWITGSDPRDAGDYLDLRWSILDLPEGRWLELGWREYAHRYFEVERSVDGGVFSPVAGGAGEVGRLRLPLGEGGGSERYRLRVEPP